MQQNSQNNIVNTVFKAIVFASAGDDSYHCAPTIRGYNQGILALIQNNNESALPHCQSQRQRQREDNSEVALRPLPCTMTAYQLEFPFHLHQDLPIQEFALRQ